MKRLGISLLFFGGVALLVFHPNKALSAEMLVYSVYRGVDMGVPGESPAKDFYVNAGHDQGIQTGTVLEVLRRVPTFDLLKEKVAQEVTFPIARIKVIHAEDNVAIARLEKVYSQDKTPIMNPVGVVIGDLVRPASGK